MSDFDMSMDFLQQSMDAEKKLQSAIKSPKNRVRGDSVFGDVAFSSDSGDDGSEKGQPMATIEGGGSEESGDDYGEDDYGEDEFEEHSGDDEDDAAQDHAKAAEA